MTLPESNILTTTSVRKIMRTGLIQKENLLQMPKEVRSFLKRALIIFIVWKLLYHLLLFPIRMPDRQLTDWTAMSTAFLYHNVLHHADVVFKEEYGEVHFPKAALYIDGKRSIGIADPCNALELFVLYIGFIFCIPASFKRRFLFITIGSIAIFVANSFRCLGLSWLHYHNYAIADFAHHYLFKMVIYAMIFYAWVLYSKKYFTNVAA
jgi:exosortase/archaeosortase family protein